MDGEKARLRRFWRDRLSVAGAPVEALVLALEAWASPFDVVLGTLALPGEPDLKDFYKRWLRAGRQLALARTSGHQMDFGFVSDLNGPWNHQASGLREPPASAKPWMPGPATLVLVPGLAFAPFPQGGVVRLGRGGGYFDRWLAVHNDDVTTLGVGFSYQLTETLPREPHDVLLDGYLDSQGFHGLEPLR